MSKVKALEKLRNMHELGCGCDYETCISCSIPQEMEKIADEAEAEIAERFAELPLDADALLIQVGDKLVNGVGGIVYTVANLIFDGRNWLYESGDNRFPCKGARHYKPQTLEDVLCKALADASCAGADIVRNLTPFEPYVTGLADEVRDMVMRELANFE